MSNLYLQIPAQNKAKDDIDVIMAANGFRNIAWSLQSRNSVARFVSKLVSVMLLFVRVHKDDVLLVQYPFKKYYELICNITHLKGGKVVTLIHDLGCFRRKKLTPAAEIVRLSHTDSLIVHNEAMQQFLVDHGYTKPVTTLGIFDYIAPDAGSCPEKQADEQWQVVYAGGLARRKSTFIYDLDSHIHRWHFNIHGQGLDEVYDDGDGKQKSVKDWQHITPRGFILSDDFVRHSVGHFGLVWDGTSIDECAGAWGEYLRVNNPHKTSFYLRSGKPVIMWKQAALTPFVLREGVGIAVDTLRDIDAALASVTPEIYAEMCKKTSVISSRLAEGYYFKKAFAEATAKLR